MTDVQVYNSNKGKRSDGPYIVIVIFNVTVFTSSLIQAAILQLSSIQSIWSEVWIGVSYVVY